MTETTTHTTVRAVMSGYNYSVFFGCQRDENGVHPSTADRIVGGWAPSKAAASEEIDRTLREA